MSTPLSQRIGIWIIAIVLLVGTLGGFLVMVLTVNNQSVDQAQQQVASGPEPLTGYSTRKFDAASVSKLTVEVLKEGSGEVVKSTDSINSSYFGWTSDGQIFDSSKKKDSADSPVTFPLSGVISGWSEGLAGIKAGSTVRLTIPAAKAYGAQGAGSILPNSPLEFIVEIHKIDNSTK